MGQPKHSSPGKGNLRAYQNIMETLVHQEIYRQIKTMPEKLLKYIDTAEVATFALNRLPPLYASSEQGKERQAAKGELKLKQEVATAVRQALAAVQRDPLRSSTPLPPNRDPRYQKWQAKVARVAELKSSVTRIEGAYVLPQGVDKDMVELQSLVGDTDNAERDQVLVSTFFKNMVEGEYIDAI